VSTSTVSGTEVLTVQEAAEILRIGRNAAYTLARRWIESEGREGMPCIELGRSLRVPRAALEQLLDGTYSAPANPRRA
jgi:excisionase family DNA binding protein